jgi:hypothetical protein
LPGFRPPTSGFGLAFGEFFVEPGKPVDQIRGTIDANGTIQTLGTANPDFKWAFINSVTYKGLFGTMLWDWQHGGVAENQTLSLYDCNQLAPDGGTPAGLARTDACFNTQDARPFVQSTTFLKLREVTIGYTLPKRVAQAIFRGAESASISLTGRNLLLITDYFGYDPESSNFGQQAITRNIDLGPYPPSRQFSLNVSVGF